MIKPLIFALYIALASSGLSVQKPVWHPSPGHTQVPIWPGAAADAQPVPGPEYMVRSKGLIGGRPVVGVYNASRPTMTVYSPSGRNTGVAVVVFPGGGFEELAIDLEGTEVCDWLTSKGITCVLLKYRVPSLPYDWRCKCRPDDFVKSSLALEDAQRTTGLVRLHAAKWQIDPHRIGVLGFSAGGYLVAEISTNFQRRLYTPVDAADKESCRPDFAVGVYPGHLWVGGDAYRLNPNVPVTRQTPPTFLVQAEDDNVDGVNQ
jgi:acetyl esterase/lipase